MCEFPCRSIEALISLKLSRMMIRRCVIYCLPHLGIFIPCTHLQSSKPRHYNNIISRKLFYILSDLLHEVYQDNLSPGQSLSSLQVYQNIGSIEWKLQEWRRDLPTLLRIRRPAEMTITSPSQFDRLGIVLTLRYLFARLLLHRASLTRLLDRLGNNMGAGNFNFADAGDFFQKSSISSLEACVASAIELVEIMYTLSSSGHRMLMSWWFSVYYGVILPLALFFSIC